MRAHITLSLAFGALLALCYSACTLEQSADLAADDEPAAAAPAGARGIGTSPSVISCGGVIRIKTDGGVIITKQVHGSIRLDGGVIVMAGAQDGTGSIRLDSGVIVMACKQNATADVQDAGPDASAQ